MARTIDEFIQKNDLQTPYQVLDLSKIHQNYRQLNEIFPAAEIFYAVKANPEKQVIRDLVQLGSSFDVASLMEIELALECGAKPSQLSFGNTIKRVEHIQKAVEHGIDKFVLDSEKELEKLAKFAPKSKIFYRLSCGQTNALCPLKYKFGCAFEEAKSLILKSHEMGLTPYGISFHVGSQQMTPETWSNPIEMAGLLFEWAGMQGIELSCLNLGGGYPASYGNSIPDIYSYGKVINQAIEKFFINKKPKIMLEPGRLMVANSGVVVSEVLLTADRWINDLKAFWVYLDVGKFLGFSEAANDKIMYRFETTKKGRLVPCYLAGPTCDSEDILYDDSNFYLPEDIDVGDMVKIHQTGAYFSSYASQFFNGFLPPKIYCINSLDQ